MIKRQIISLPCKRQKENVNSQKSRVVSSFWWEENTMSQNLTTGLVIDLVSLSNNKSVKKRQDDKLRQVSWVEGPDIISPSQLAKWGCLSYFSEFHSSLSRWIQGSLSLACERGHSQTSQVEPPFSLPLLSFHSRWHFLPILLRYYVSSFLSVAHILPWGIKHPIMHDKGTATL